MCVRSMSPYGSVHDEWLIMKLCMYVGYHDANNVSNFGGDPVTQLNLKTFTKFNFSFCILLDKPRGRPKSSSTSRARK